MLIAVIAPRLRTLGLLLALTVSGAGCSGTTSGTGAVGGPVSGSRSASPDFPGTRSGQTSSPALSTPAAPGGSSARPVPAAPLRTLAVQATDGIAYTVQLWAEVQNQTCVDHAYGAAMVRFLTEHPCTGLRRYLGTTTVNGRQVGFAMSSTGFHSPADDPYLDTSRFDRLERADGTGSINDLMREGYRLPSGPSAVPAAEVFNVLGQDDGVTVWDAWYLDGTTPAHDPALIRMTQDLFLQF